MDAVMSGDEASAKASASSATPTDQPKRCPPNPHIVHREIVDKPGYDIFGQAIADVKKPVDVSCPNCGRVVASNRFAPHLEKCMMNMGRQSSRVAVQRMKTGDHDDILQDDEEFEEADLEAAFASADLRGTRKRLRNSSSPRPQKIRRLALEPDQDGSGASGAGPSSTTSSTSSSPRSTQMSSTGSSGSDWAVASAESSASSASSSNSSASSSNSSTSGSNGSSHTLQQDQSSAAAAGDLIGLPDDFLRLDADGRHAVVSETCAVVDAETMKMCDRPLSCHIHTEQERHTLRLQVLSVSQASADDTDSLGASQPTFEASLDVDNEAGVELRSGLDTSRTAPASSPGPAHASSSSDPGVSDGGASRKGKRRGRSR